MLTRLGAPGTLNEETTEALVLSPRDLVGSVLLAETPSPQYQVL